MKITLSAAMRARDVSRPRPEQLAEAAVREEPGSAAPGAPPGAPPPTEEDEQPRNRRRRHRTR
jgi:hypothetical protein